MYYHRARFLQSRLHYLLNLPQTKPIEYILYNIRSSCDVDTIFIFRDGGVRRNFRN